MYYKTSRSNFAIQWSTGQTRLFSPVALLDWGISWCPRMQNLIKIWLGRDWKPCVKYSGLRMKVIVYSYSDDILAIIGLGILLSEMPVKVSPNINVLWVVITVMTWWRCHHCNTPPTVVWWPQHSHWVSSCQCRWQTHSWWHCQSAKISNCDSLC